MIPDCIYLQDVPITDVSDNMPGKGLDRATELLITYASAAIFIEPFLTISSVR